jgi:hypothetical protein
MAVICGRIVNVDALPVRNFDEMTNIDPDYVIQLQRAAWVARDCLRSYLKYGDWDEHADYGTQAAFDALSDALIPDDENVES